MCMHHHSLHLMHVATTRQPSRKRSSGEDESEAGSAKKQKQSSGKVPEFKVQENTRCGECIGCYRKDDCGDCTACK